MGSTARELAEGILRIDEQFGSQQKSILVRVTQDEWYPIVGLAKEMLKEEEKVTPTLSSSLYDEDLISTVPDNIPAAVRERWLHNRKKMKPQMSEGVCEQTYGARCDVEFANECCFGFSTLCPGPCACGCHGRYLDQRHVLPQKEEKSDV